MRMVKTGRPPLPPEKRRTERVEIALTVEEREWLEAIAAREGTPPATWARRVMVRAIKRGRNR